MRSLPLAGRLLVIGSTMIDLITYCDVFPDDGETLLGRSFEQGFGGKGANQAVMAARLGGTVHFVGRVGDDRYGSEILDNLSDQRVDVAGITVTPGTTSGMAPIWVDSTARNRILIVPGANAVLSASDVEAAIVSLRGVDVVLGQLETGQAATMAGFRWARAVGATTVLNPAPAAKLSPALLSLVDWLVPNETEFALLWGAPASKGAVTEAAHAWGCALVVTLGSEGAFVAEQGSVLHVAALPVDAVDTTGAGDAFVGAFALALAAGWSTADAVELAAVCGGLSTTGAGTQRSYPSCPAVRDVFEGRHRVKGEEDGRTT